MKKSLHSKFHILNSSKGFTLIEILIVVAIIGILASTVLVGLLPAQRQGRDARRISDLRQVQNALELYFNANGVYPNVPTWNNLQTTLAAAAIGVSNVPDDPKSGAHYQYVSDGATYVLGATLEDGNNPNLRDSIKINPIQGGFSCGSPVYCVSL